MLNGTFYDRNTWKGYIVYLTNKISKFDNALLCTKAIFTAPKTFEDGTVYENQGNIMFVGNNQDTLETLKAKYDGSEVLYELAEEVIEPFTEEQEETLLNIKTEVGTNIFTTTDDLLPDIQITQYNPTVYPLDYKLCWIIYNYSIYKFINTVTGYQDTGRRYTESNFTEKSGNFEFIIRYERG